MDIYQPTDFVRKHNTHF